MMASAALFLLSPGGANYPRFDTRNRTPILTFSESADETGILTGVMDRDYGNGGLTLDIWFGCAAASGNVEWEAGFENLVGQALDSDGFAAAQSCGGTAVVNGQAAKASIVFTDGAQIDNLSGGDPFRMFVRRETATSGNAAGMAQLLGMLLYETVA